MSSQEGVSKVSSQEGVSKVLVSSQEGVSKVSSQEGVSKVLVSSQEGVSKVSSPLEPMQVAAQVSSSAKWDGEEDKTLGVWGEEARGVTPSKQSSNAKQQKLKVHQLLVKVRCLPPPPPPPPPPPKL